LLVTVLTPTEDRWGIDRAATTLIEARWRLGPTLDLVDDDGRLWARFTVERRGPRVLDVDWGSNQVPIDVQAGLSAVPRPFPAVRFPQSTSPTAVRVQPDYIEWTSPGSVRVTAARAAAVAGQPVEEDPAPQSVLLRFSVAKRRDVVPCPALPTPGEAPVRLRAHPRSGAPMHPRGADQALVLDLAAGTSPQLAAAAARAARRVSEELEAATGTPELVRVRPNRCQVEVLQAILGDDLSPALSIERCSPTGRCPGLEQACRDLEGATWDPSTQRSSFEWARVGDQRVHLVEGLHRTGTWGSYAAVAAPGDGCIVRVALQVREAAIEARASAVADLVDQLSTARRGPEIIEQWASSRRARAWLAEQTGTGGFASRLETRRTSPGPRPPDGRLQRESWSRLSDLGPWPPRDDGRWMDRRTAVDPALDPAWLDARVALGRWGYGDVEPPPGTAVLAVRLAALGPLAAAQVTTEALLNHALLRAMVVALGVGPNPAASFDGLNFGASGLTASVTDDLPLVHRIDATELGPYDVAGLRYLYAGQVPVFDRPVPEASEILRARRRLDIDALPDFLCGGACPDLAAALSVWTRRRYLPLADAPPHRVPFERCSLRDALVARGVGCAQFDVGLRPHESFARGYADWSFAVAATDAEPSAGLVRLLRQSRVAAEALDAQPLDTLASPYSRSLMATVANGLNLVADLSTRPRARRLCPSADGIVPCPPPNDGTPSFETPRWWLRWTGSADDLAVHAWWLLALDGDGPGHPGGLFGAELRELSAWAAGSVDAGRMPSAPHYCLGGSDLDAVEPARLLDARTGAPHPPPPGRCRLPTPILVRTPELDPAPLADATLLLTPTAQPTLRWMMESDDDPNAEPRCRVRLNGIAWHAIPDPDPWLDPACEVQDDVRRRASHTSADALSQRLEYLRTIQLLISG
jgi:hypothetical protein